jgi:hypothetical protein
VIDKLNDDSSKFSLKPFSFREFEAFLILLKDEGQKLSFLKHHIDKRFQHNSRTKGYDYINQLCSKILCPKCKSINIEEIEQRREVEKKEGKKYACEFCKSQFYEKDIKNHLAYKKKDSNLATRVYIQKDVRLEYEKFILPTISDVREVAEKLLREKATQAKNYELQKEKILNYTDDISNSIKELIKNTSAKNIKSSRFRKRIDEKIQGCLNSELLASSFFGLQVGEKDTST